MMKSLLIKDTTREEREEIIRSSMDCGGGCENCSSCWLGGGSPWDIYQDYIDGKREIREINAVYMEEYRQGRAEDIRLDGRGKKRIHQEKVSVHS